MSAHPDLAEEANQIRDDPGVTDLVSRARNGDKTAWDALVERYAPLVWSICSRHHLDGAEADDAGRSVWLQLLDHLDTICDPAALAGWLAATTRRECGRVARAAQAPGAAGLRGMRRPSPMNRPGPASMNCWRPSATRRFARRSCTCPFSASG